ncbi:MAG: hypothetical protein K9J82_07460 [Methylotenera sp.]|nr:hypothetical protein [Methylotenera sp.]
MKFSLGVSSNAAAAAVPQVGNPGAVGKRRSHASGPAQIAAGLAQMAPTLPVTGSTMPVM